MNYIKGKGILVGEYSEADLDRGIDKIDLKKVQDDNPNYTYTYTEFIKRKGEIIGIRLYACNLEDLKI